MSEPEGDVKIENAYARGESASAHPFLHPLAHDVRAWEYRLGYRGDIEGLRAVAILLVVADHARVTWLRGGFVGVDVFFVLSGYLITALLVQDIVENGGIRFARFYARRFRRLLPALALMLVCVSVLAAMLLAPSDQATQATAAASAAVWLSNLHFAFSTLDYFGPTAAHNLFLHTWSLGVEEQFYLVWPALLALLLGGWRLHRTHLNIGRLKLAMIAIALASLTACVSWTYLSPQLAFYMMPARAWQFALGALTLLYFGTPDRDAHPDGEPGPSAPATGRSRGLIRWAGWAGLLMILLAAVLFDSDMSYPGWRALLPSIGAAAVLAAGARAAGGGVARALSWRPMQEVGRVSYSLYLWHWPILLLGGALIALDDPVHRLALVAISLIIAVLSYRCFEAPIRRNAKLVSKPRLLVFGALALMVIINALALRWYGSAKDWMNLPLQRTFREAHVDAPVIYAMGCDDWFHSARVRICAFGPSNAAHTAVLMGDSIAGQWTPAVAEVFNRPGWRLLILTKSSCPMVDAPYFYGRIGREYTECATWRKEGLKQLVTLKPDVVIFSSFPTGAITEQQWINGSAAVLQRINGSVGRIFVLRATPRLPFDGPDCLSAEKWQPALLVRPDECKATAYWPQNNRVYAALMQAVRSFKNVSTLDMNDLICPAGICAAERNGKIVFRDNQHLTASFARSLGQPMAQRMDTREWVSAATGNGPGT